MSFAIVVLLARIGLVLALYVFLFVVVRAMLRDLRRAAILPTRQTGAAAPRATAQLVVLAAGQTHYQVGQRFTLQQQTLLGRDQGCDIPIEDDFVSAQHAKIALVNGAWLAQDLQSTNGTRLNGSRLRGTAPLKTGDLLDLGRLHLRFVLEP